MSGIGGGEIVMVLFILFFVLSPADFKAALRFLGRLHSKYQDLMEEYLYQDIPDEKNSAHTAGTTGKTRVYDANISEENIQQKDPE